jgi:galactokinase
LYNSLINSNIKNNIAIRTPGRICLFGDHQDYLGLPVIACAINRHIYLTAKKNFRPYILINKPDIGEQRILELPLKITQVESGDYFLAAIKILEAYNCHPEEGYEITITGNIPINAGTSSSSAVIISWVQFLISAYGCNQTITREFISKIAYEAEVAFHGFPGGKMDQYSIGLGDIIYLETGENFAYKTFKKHLPGLVVAESGIPKQTTGVLGELKEKALEAIKHVKNHIPGFQIENVSKDEYLSFAKYIPKPFWLYFEAAILNHDITQRAFLEFQKTNLEYRKIGALINEHHQILKEHLTITVPLIDRMINASLSAGALGAKIVGSGRGGSIVVLVEEGTQNEVIRAIMKSGAKDAYSVEIDSGTEIIKLD